MTTYVDYSPTLAATPWIYQFPLGKKVWVAIANESQSALTVNAYSNHGPGLPTINVDAGQPLVKQLEFYLIEIAGSSGAVFNVKISDEEPNLGKRQVSSNSTLQVLLPSGPVQGGTNATLYTCPPGFRARVLRGGWIYGSVASDLTTAVDVNYGGTVGVIEHVIMLNESIASAGDITFGVEPSDSVVMNTYPVLMPGDSVFVSNGGSSDTAPDAFVEIEQEPL